MEFRVLGPVELWHGGQRANLGHAKQRSVLAVLLMEVGRVVPTGVLIDRVWDHRPPDAALNVLYGYVARLRKALAPAGAWLARDSGGYLLDIDADLVDAHRFNRLVASACSTMPIGRAVALLDEALALWRGTPFVGVSNHWAAVTREALEERRLAAIVQRNEWKLRIGRDPDVVSQLLELVGARPFDERLVGQLMLAMCRTGRTCDALEQYRLARRRLREERGTDPGPLLREVQRRVLSLT